MTDTAKVTGDAGAELRAVVRSKYGEAAKRAGSSGEKASCGSGCGCGEGGGDAITRDLYDAVTASSLPETAVLASLGCGNPTALAELGEGEVVLDLGSGGGIDVLLSARRVGPTGKAYGLDMTDEMLDLARRNAAEAGVENVEFLKGEIEAIPLPAASVDVIISNCVINLSADKAQVLREAFRVLKPGGRFAVSDVLVRGEIPAEMRRNMELWVGCVAGALEEGELLSLLADTGFEEGSIEVTREYRAEDARAWLEEAGLDVDVMAAAVDGRVVSGFVRATKPLAVGAAATIRPAGASDVPAVLALLEASGLPTAGVEAGAAGFLVAELGGRIVGVAGLERYGPAALLRSVAVAESARGLGLGAMLTRRILESAALGGVRAVYLLTTTAESYFPRLGFRRIERESVPATVRESVEFTTACPSTAAVLLLDLEGSA